MSISLIPFEGPHVLVVTRDVHLQQFIRSALEDVCGTTAAYTASMAYALLLECPPDLVITATELPGSYVGHDVLEVVRTLPGYESMPVIGIASNSLTEEGDDDRAQGFDAYFPWLLHQEELRATVLRVLNFVEKQPVPLGDGYLNEEIPVLSEGDQTTPTRSGCHAS